jgi:integrase/recombinase XerD
MEFTAQIDDFLLRKRRKAGPTYEQYRFVLERIFLPWCEVAHLDSPADCNDRAMDRFTDSLLNRAKPLSVATIRTYVRAVRVFLTWAKVPKGDYEQLAEPERLRNVLSRQEIDRMEHVATVERDKLIVRVLADTGIRVGELIGLREQSLFANTNAHHYFIRVIGKGDREREVGIPEGLYRRLGRLAREQDCEYIFNAKRGGRLTRHGVDRIVRQLAKAAKIERRVWPHLFRHSYVTQMARRKVPLQDTMKAVGHKTAAMTMTIYNHTTADDSYDVLMAALK